MRCRLTLRAEVVVRHPEKFAILKKQPTMTGTELRQSGTMRTRKGKLGTADLWREVTKNFILVRIRLDILVDGVRV